MNVETGEHKILSKARIPIIGFGFFRRHEQDPWFSLKDYNHWIPPIRGGRQGSQAITSSGFIPIARDFVELGYLERQDISPEQRTGGDKTKVQFQVTDGGVEAMLDSLVHHVTHGETVPGLLCAPEIAGLVLDTTDFMDRVTHNIFQLTRQQQRMGWTPVVIPPASTEVQ